jgi:hypothetical protein
MRKFRVGWRPNALYPIAEPHFGAELVSACHGPANSACVICGAVRVSRGRNTGEADIGEGLQMHCKCTM